jgi:hypothetical protein
MNGLTCPFCGKPVGPRDPGVWHRVEGWERPGKAGGSDITLREPREGLAHAECVAMKKMGVDPQQDPLL